MASFSDVGFGAQLFPKRHTITIIKMLDPVTFMVKECPNDNMSISARDFIHLEATVLSHVDRFDIEPVDNVLPRKGIYVIVKPKTGTIWSRGRVDALLELSKQILVNVYLVDEGITVSVPPKNLRYPEEKMFDVPFQAFEFILYNLNPLSLSYNEDMMMRKMPSDKWDISAFNYVRDFLSGKCTVEIEVQKTDQTGRFYGKMFSPIDEEVCLNEELVSKGYAYNSKIQRDRSCDTSPEIESNSESDSGVRVEVQSILNKKRGHFGKSELNEQRLVPGVGRGVSRRRNRSNQISMLQPLDTNTSYQKSPPQISQKPHPLGTAGLGRGVLNSAILKKYNDLNEKHKGLTSNPQKGIIDEEESQVMDKLNLLKISRTKIKNMEPQEDK